MNMLKCLLVAACFLPLSMQAQEVINLYPDSIPNAKPSSLQDMPQQPSGLIRRSIHPTLEVYLPEKEKATGTAVVICPGGGYSVIVYDGEGIQTAKAFAQRGVAAFVLKYRLPNDSFEVDKTIAPLQDAQQAIKMVRDNAAKWNVDTGKVGIIGFSAGGHLASTEATHYQNALIPNKNNTSLRPNFLMIVYPVISMQDSLTHAGSRQQLLGDHPSKDAIDNYSNELQVTDQTPPTWITHAADDKVVDVDNSILFFEQLRHHNVPVELHIYPKGGHGFIFQHPGWMEPLFLWMKNNHWIN